MFQFLNKPFAFTSYNVQSRLSAALATGLFVTFFLWLFDNKEQENILVFADNGAVVCISQLLFLFLFHKLVVGKRNTADIKLWQYLSGVAGGTVLCFSLMYIYVTPVYFKTAYSFAGYINYIIGNLPFVFPVLLFVVAADYIFILKNRLRFREAPIIKKDKAIAAEMYVTEANDFALKNEFGASVFCVRKSDILFIKSADNYIEICYLYEDKPVKKMLRYQLSAVEADPANRFLFRVHRSYLCNLENTACISGGLQNCTLHFNNSPVTIPVSRAKAKEVMRIVNGS
jgi:LytTr DNA-binding domain